MISHDKIREMYIGCTSKALRYLVVTNCADRMVRYIADYMAKNDMLGGFMSLSNRYIQFPNNGKISIVSLAQPVEAFMGRFVDEVVYDDKVRELKEKLHIVSMSDMEKYE